MTRSSRTLARALDRAVSGVAILCGRVALPLIVMCGVGLVLGRHLRIGWTADLKEVEAALFFGLVMTSFGYAYLRDAHVRVDLASRRFPPRVRAGVELAGCALVVAPLCAVLLWYGGESAWWSFVHGERLPFGNLPLQWVVRAAVPAGAALLLAAAAAISIRCVAVLAAPRAAPGPFDEDRAA